MKKNTNIFYLTNCIIAGLLILSTSVTMAQQLAFPTAEGYGKYVTGGRGGAVFEVTNLNASGSGSFGAAVSASGPRTVVFRVSGTITGNFNIKNGDITIAGQTAPGDGICIKGNLTTAADNIIIRYIRVRFDLSTGENDGMGGRFHKNIIFDHVSVSWSTDETLSLYHNDNTTVQWCIISEACPKGTTDEHRFGGIWGNNHGTWHHNLIADNASRNPRWASGCGYNDYRNNVIYNWDYQSCYGGEAHQVGDDRYVFSTMNMIGNYYKPGPATNDGVKRRIAEPSARASDDKGSWYVSDNYVVGYPDVTADNWQGIDGTNYIKLKAPWPAMTINQQTPQDAYVSVLAGAGCSFPNRDAIDARIMQEVNLGIAIYGNDGIIDSPSDVGGWPILSSTTPPADSDHDGMPDSWETAHGLNPNDASDRNTVDPSGYTELEMYIDGLVDSTSCSSEPVSGVSMSPSSATIIAGLTTQLVAIVQPTCAGNKNVTWSSSNTSVATVSATGLVTGVTTGSVVITATTEDGSFTAQSAITVVYVPVTGVSVSPSGASIAVGGTAYLTATVSPSDASNADVSWSSSDPSVATVNSSGEVTGIAQGTATITATTADGNFTSQCAVTVAKLDAYEAENNTSQSGNSVLTSFSGYTGTGYVDFGNNGAWIEWNNIDGGNGGNATLIFRYANGSTVNRQVGISVNGTAIGNLTMAPTGSWATWSTQSITASFNSGNNTIRVTANTDNGGPNLDNVNVAVGSTTSSGIDVTDGDAGLDIVCYPVPVKDILNIKFNHAINEAIDIQLLDPTGRIVRFKREVVGINCQLDMTGLNKGLYLLKITGSSINMAKTIIN